MDNSRKQVFVKDQEVVLVRDLTIQDLIHADISNSETQAIVLLAGTKGKIVSPALTSWGVRVKFDEPRPGYFHAKLARVSCREDGEWSIDRDLIQPVANKERMTYGEKVTFPHDTEGAFRSTVEAGKIYTVVNRGTDLDDDIRVIEDGNDDASRVYVKWFKAVPVTDAAVEEPKKLWGLYPYGDIVHLEEPIMVVFTRDYTYAELDNEGQQPVSETNKLLARAGQVGEVDVIRLIPVYGVGKARVTFFDLHHANSQSEGRLDFWNLDVDGIVPLRNYEDGKVVTVTQYKGLPVVDLDEGIPEVGTEATVFLDVYETRVGSDGLLRIDTGKRNWSFRDEDEVYIVEVNKEAFKADSDNCSLKIAHFEDGSGPTLWVRPTDLNLPEDNE